MGLCRVGLARSPPESLRIGQPLLLHVSIWDDMAVEASIPGLEDVWVTVTAELYQSRTTPQPSPPTVVLWGQKHDQNPPEASPQQHNLRLRAKGGGHTARAGPRDPIEITFEHITAAAAIGHCPGVALARWACLTLEARSCDGALDGRPGGVTCGGYVVLPLSVGPLRLLPAVDSVDATDAAATCSPSALRVASQLQWARRLWVTDDTDEGSDEGDEDEEGEGEEEALQTNRRICRPPLMVTEEAAEAAEISGSTWDAGVVLGAYLAWWWRRHGATSGCTAAVELGCGVGVAGLALAAAAATTLPPLQLLLTDIDPHALRRVEHNAVLNRLRLSGTVSHTGSHCDSLKVDGGGGEPRRALELPWGCEAAEALRERERACFTDAAPPPLVFAADVVYEESTFLPLVETLAVLSTPASQVILAYRLRTTRATAAHFFHLLGMWFEEPQPVRYELLHRTYTAADVTLYQLRRRPARLLPAPCAYCAMLLRTVGAPSG